MNSYIVRWYTKVGSFSYRGGYSVIDAADKNGARRSLRRNLALFNGEKLHITAMCARTNENTRKKRSRIPSAECKVDNERGIVSL